MTPLLLHCHLMPWLDNTVCNAIGVSAIVVATVGTAWVVWWAGR